jgi:hypothetical protein
MYIIDYFTPMMLSTDIIDLKFERLDKSGAHMALLMALSRGEVIVNGILDDSFGDEIQSGLNVTMSRMCDVMVTFPMDKDTDQQLLVVQRDAEGDIHWWLVTSFAV